MQEKLLLVPSQLSPVALSLILILSHFCCTPVSHHISVLTICQVSLICFLFSSFTCLHLTQNLIFVIFSPTVFIPSSFPLLLLSRYALNVDAKEGNEWKEGKERKGVNKEGKEVESSRPISVMSSLSYRKRSNLDSIGGKADALFSTLKENAESEDILSFHKAKPKTSALKDDTYSVSPRRKSQAGDDMNGRESVMSQANTQARKGMDSLWESFDKESAISFTAPSQSSLHLGLSPENDAKSNISFGLSSPLERRQCTSHLDLGRGGRSLYGSSPSSPCFSRRSGGRSPGSISQADSHRSLARSCRLSEFGVDIDDSRSMAFTERSAYSPHSSTGRSMSMPPPQARSSTADNDPLDNLDIKSVSHRNFLDPDLEKAINEVLSFKPIKFKRKSLDDSENEEEKSKNDEYDSKGNCESTYPSSSIRRSASAVDCMRSSRSTSSCSSQNRSKSKGKSKKKKRSCSSESDSSGDDHHRRSSSKRRSKKSKKKSKKRDESSSSSSSSSSSDSESDTGSSSGASTISYRSSSSVKRAPVRKVLSPEGEGEARPQSKSLPLNKKDDKKRKKKVDSLMMKYLYRPDSD
ncbi:uncharacterized protein [Chaetodon trifascialis]|uniref:uncharacterized protein n=1 Tax=Chaetodon trifascialis TaxID=109706 RepID=UPI0039967C88